MLSHVQLFATHGLEPPRLLCALVYHLYGKRVGHVFQVTSCHLLG